MKKIVYILFFAATLLVAQEKSSNDGISLAAYIPRQTERIPSSAKRMLLNRLTQIITKNGISNNVYNSRFVLAPSVSILSKDITPTAPPKTALNLNVTLYIGDGISGTLFASQSIELKGVGNNENKAYISAIKRLSPKNPEILEFIEVGKKKIIEYYNANCSNIIKKAASLEAQNKFEEALVELTNVPVASTCFNKVKSKIKVLYKKVIDRDCKLKLAEATAIWAANQDIDAANEAGAILSTIEPQGACYGKVKSLYAKIAARVKDLSDRDWNYKLKELDLKKTYIKAARDIGVAYGKNQPKNVTYNTKTWR
ncbi:hypothetical protein LNJ08_09250 [Tenacibaculum finnmarkense genomovar ulcerans]|uniref:hypothetical protein n=1 Tax=Tenacibaculum finnmarkense TaxID=2781243 RepID=UPI001E520096|nr:hypothetical protein [Tenacibaculum finnmarkense]MCD8454581.1 hypothetical protein [Tenacibaculum finnmarkense genomovar ulcerans]